MKENTIVSEKPAFKTVSAPLLQSLEAQSEKYKECQEKLLRTLSDWDNSRKRMALEKDTAVKFAVENFLENLLPILDSFELGIKAAQKSDNTETIIEGFKMTLQLFLKTLEESGVKAIDALHETFDPQKHEAVGHQESSEHPEGTVIEQIRKGYFLKDRLIRASTVIVSRGAEK